MSSQVTQLESIVGRFPVITGTNWQFERCRGGLSGSEAWKVEGSSQCFCLKRMPPDFPVNLLIEIHQAANLRRQRGMNTLAGFFPTHTGVTYIQQEGSFWELQNWLEGTSPATPPTAGQTKQMFGLLADFHLLGDRPGPGLDVSPGVARRTAIFQQYRSARPADMHRQIARIGDPQWQAIVRDLVDSFFDQRCRLESLLGHLQRERATLRQCIGDPRPENFRFDREKLIGMFDLGSLRRDSIALDVARLAGELTVDGCVEWEETFAQLPLSCRLTPSEERLAIGLDAANLLLTGLNWLQWLSSDGHSFENCDQVSLRLQHFHSRMLKIDTHLAWKI